MQPERLIQELQTWLVVAIADCAFHKNKQKVEIFGKPCSEAAHDIYHNNRCF